MMYFYKQIVSESIISVESKSKDSVSPGFEEATREEYDSYMASMPPPKPKPPPRNILAEIDALKARITELEKTPTLDIS